MILSNIKYAEKYYALNPYFKAAFDFLKSIPSDFTGDFKGDGFSGSVVIPDIKEKSMDDIVLEAHRDYLDIHYCIEGAEGFGYADINSLMPKTEYDEGNDYLLLKGDFSSMTIKEGEFCIVFPEDAHAPCMSSGGDMALKKAIVKIKVN